MDKPQQRFEIRQRVVEGRTVVANRAFDHETNREVALKQLRDDHCTFPERVAAFSASAKLGARLLHAGLVPVIAARRVGNRIYSVSPWVTGVMLTEIPRPMDVALVAAIISQVSEAIAMAHANNTLLRGLNPRDFIIRSDGQVLLLDLNKLQAPGASGPLPPTTSRGEVLRYLPMEARSNGMLDIVTDVFCLGALTLELLTGVPPTVEGAVDMKPGLITALTAAGPTGQMAKLAMTLASPRPDQRPRSVSNLPGTLAPLWAPGGTSPRAVVAAAVARHAPQVRSTPPAPVREAPKPATTPVSTPRATIPTLVLPTAPATVPQEDELLQFFEDTTSEFERRKVREALGDETAPPPAVPSQDPWGLRSDGRFRSLNDDISSEGDQSGFAYVNDSGRTVLGQPQPTPARLPTRGGTPVGPRPTPTDRSATTPRPQGAPAPRPGTLTKRPATTDPAATPPDGQKWEDKTR